MSKVKGVRFSQREEQLIDEFLVKNSFLDFSTLAKIAILEFIRNPQIQLKPVDVPVKKEINDVRPTQ